MSQQPGKPGGSVNPQELDVFEFARSGRQAAGCVRVVQMPRMLAEVPVDAPERDAVFTWQAEGSTQAELQDDGSEAAQPYLRLAVHGAAWLECQRCLAPYEQAFDIDATYRLVLTEEEADEYPLDDDELEVIVGSRQFNLVELIEEELLLSVPLVPKHEVCPQVHESLASGVGDVDVGDGNPATEGENAKCDDPGEGAGGSGKPNPFAALAALKRGAGGNDDGGKKH
jgi:uncharacterized protein